jgi:tRNA(Ile)-lysidine synthase
MQLLEEVERSIRSRHLFRPRQRIVIAASGGLDSTVLLHILARLAKPAGWRLTVAHFNHRLRGRSSDADERLVRHTAAALGLPCFVEQGAVRAFSGEERISIEMAARHLRHQFLARVARNSRSPGVALAHHADDQVELFFLRLLRGSGGEGLAGMKWRNPSPVDQKVELVRPLLGHTRPQLLEFARTNKLRFRDDATNASPGILRNRIRHQLIPWLKKHYDPRLERAVLRTMNVVAAEAEAVTLFAQQWLQQNPQAPKPHRSRSTHHPPHSLRHAPPAFAALPLAVERQCIRLQLLGLGVAADFDLVEHLLARPGTLVSVGDAFAICSATGVVEVKAQPNPKFRPASAQIELGREAGRAIFDKVQFRWRFHSRNSPNRLFGRPGCEWFDAHRVGSPIVLRHWRPGDRFQPSGMARSVKLQDLFTNEKFPPAQRRDLIIATTAHGEPFWVEGLRISEQFKLTNRTTSALQLAWKRL